MSYSITLEYQGGEPAIVDRHEEGGSPPLGGSLEAAMDITYNYSQFFYSTIDEKDGIRWLYGKSFAEYMDRLNNTVFELGTWQDEDYWESTPGNAGHALGVLLQWGEQHPDAVFRGD